MLIRHYITFAYTLPLRPQEIAVSARRSPTRPKQSPDEVGGRRQGSQKSRRRRMNLMIDPALLRQATAALGTANKSDAVNIALARLAEDAAILAGIDSAIGAIPDFPKVET